MRADEMEGFSSSSSSSSAAAAFGVVGVISVVLGKSVPRGGRFWRDGGCAGFGAAWLVGWIGWAWVIWFGMGSLVWEVCLFEVWVF